MDGADSANILKKGEETMKEHIEALKAALKANSKPETIAAELGFTLLTDEQRTSLKKMEAVETKVGDIEAFVNQVIDERAENFTALRDKSLETTFTNKDVREAAGSLFQLKSGSVAEIEAEVTRLKEMGIIKQMQSIIAAGINYSPGADEPAKTGSTKQDVEA